MPFCFLTVRKKGHITLFRGCEDDMPWGGGVLSTTPPVPAPPELAPLRGRPEPVRLLGLRERDRHQSHRPRGRPPAAASRQTWSWGWPAGSPASRWRSQSCRQERRSPEQSIIWNNKLISNRAGHALFLTRYRCSDLPKMIFALSRYFRTRYRFIADFSCPFGGGGNSLFLTFTPCLRSTMCAGSSRP